MIYSTRVSWRVNWSQQWKVVVESRFWCNFFLPVLYCKFEMWDDDGSLLVMAHIKIQTLSVPSLVSLVLRFMSWERNANHYFGHFIHFIVMRNMWTCTAPSYRKVLYDLSHGRICMFPYSFETCSQISPIVNVIFITIYILCVYIQNIYSIFSSFMSLISLRYHKNKLASYGCWTCGFGAQTWPN